MAKVEVKVQEEKEPAREQLKPGSVQDAVRTLFLTGVGVLVMAQEAAAGFVSALAEQGGRFQEDGRRLVRDGLDMQKHQVRKIVDRGKQEAQRAEGELQTRVETMLGHAQIPTKGDIEALSAKISALTEQVNELNSAQR